MITLTAIVAKEAEADHIVELYKDYFDKILIQVNGEKPKNKAYKYFKWCDDFAAARNDLLQYVDTEYWSWIDSDDTIDKPERFKQLEIIMDRDELDAIYLPYDYQRNEYGELEAYQYRERLLRTSHPWVWKGAIHETPISESTPKVAHNDEVVFKHKLKTEEEIMRSAKRNHEILLREYDKKERDPRIVFYLAGSYMFFNKDEEAVKCYKEYISASGWDEEKYRAWCNVAIINLRQKEPAQAISSCFAAINLLPEYPEAYLTLAQAYYVLDEHEKVIHWLKIGLAKPEPDTLSITSPNKRILAIITGALSEMSMGHTADAYDLIEMAAKMSPDSPYVAQYSPLITYSHEETEAVQQVQQLADYYAKYGGDIEKLIRSLPANVFKDPRLMEVRYKYLPSKVWPEKSIVFYCGPSLESWWPDTLDKGMGGSEEAIVYLTRELAKLGWEVTVYNDREEELVSDGVTYLPWTTMNPNDKFSHYVAWRAPENVRDVNAKHKYVDMHDVIQEERVNGAAEYVDKFFVKSQYHRSLYPKVPDDKFVVISNGIVREQFNA